MSDEDDEVSETTKLVKEEKKKEINADLDYFEL